MTTCSENEKLIGNWRLLSLTWKNLATGETKEVYGKSPKGFLNYGRDGRMLVLIVMEGRPKPADVSKVTPEEGLELLKSVTAYGATFEFDGNTVTHHIDMSANETWTGTDQARIVKIDGTRLTLSTPPTLAPDGTRGVAVLTWERNDPGGSPEGG
jgi:lipocalin-like protein